MQPDDSPTPPSVSQPDYGFLTQPAKKRLNLPPFLGGRRGKIITVVGGLVLIVILLVIIKGLIFPPPFNEGDYLLLIKRQQEIIHILSVDVNSNTTGQLTPADQNLSATAYLSIGTAQSTTITFLKDYGDKITQGNLKNNYDTTVDQQFTSSLQSNTFDSFFKSEMNLQLSNYEQELTSAYNATDRGNNGRSLLKSEYAEAQLLIKALSSANS